ncbi:MAG: hypothetical protein ACI8ZM_002945 [Crocinitomix sp.]|jgi:hypothetical protein
MRSNILVSIVLISSVQCYSQPTVDTLEGNNARVHIANNGVFFNEFFDSAAGYEIPKGEDKNLFYSSGFWFGGIDDEGILRLSAQDYIGGSDQFPGAITTTGTPEVTDPVVGGGGYSVSREEIETHIASLDLVDYEIPESILNWPAHGDLDLDLDFYLAPFVDINGDAIYNPEEGDYPEIRGDYATYVIMNDVAEDHLTAGLPLGIEMHFMFYQYATDDYLNDATFINLKLINRGSHNYSDFRTGYFLDTDLGNYADDYVGCNPGTNLGFAYNSTNIDADGVIIPGYGENPPSTGVVLLNHEMSSFTAFTVGVGPMSDPTLPSEYWNYLNSKWKDGTHFTYGGTGYGGTDETDYLYSGNPNSPSSWSEIIEGNTAGDRRILLVADGVSLEPGQMMCYDYAVLYNREGDFLENVQNIIDLSAEVKLFYTEQSHYSCNQSYLNISEKKEIQEVKVYPNPSTGNFVINFEGVYDFELFGIDGRKVMSKKDNIGITKIESDFTSGTYLLVISQNGERFHSKVIIEK